MYVYVMECYADGEIKMFSSEEKAEDFWNRHQYEYTRPERFELK